MSGQQRPATITGRARTPTKTKSSRRDAIVRTGLIAGALLALSLSTASAQEGLPRDGSVLPIPTPPFKGKIGKTFEDSKQHYPQPVHPPTGAPNVVLILVDDLGFGQPGTFGGPVPTPALDALAADGLRYTRFHSTAICSPTRAALLTGRNHHQVATGTITELSTGYPGYNSIWPRDTASIAQILKDSGYSTAAFGKWHNTPDWETSPIGPFDHWPTSLGSNTGTASRAARPTSGGRSCSAARPRWNRRSGLRTATTSTLTWSTRHHMDRPAAVDLARQAVLRLFRDRRGSRAVARRPGMDRQVKGTVRCACRRSHARRSLASSLRTPI
jgi:hypothetical protein